MQWYKSEPILEQLQKQFTFEDEFAFVLYYKVKTDVNQAVLYLLEEMNEAEVVVNISILFSQQMKFDQKGGQEVKK